jgi:CxxC-x17-CxxC domain-containing protein
MVEQKKSRRARAKDKEAYNPHINFEREGAKTNARKWPTPVICVTCKKEFTLPFKPRKPEVYCDDCFKKNKK